MNSKGKRVGRPTTQESAATYRQMGQMTKGSSIFFEGKTTADLNAWRRNAKRIGMDVMMRYTEDDEITGKAGTRVWCKSPALKSLLNKVLSTTEPDDEDDEL